MTHLQPRVGVSSVVMKSGAEWAHVIIPADTAKPLPWEVQLVAGVRSVSDHDSLRVDVPRNALEVPAVAQWFAEHGSVAFPPKSHSLVTPATRVPYAHQIVAANAALARGGLLLGDEPGLGKTTSASIAAETARRATGRPVLIVAPRSLRDVWHDELTTLGFVTEPHHFLALEGKHGDAKRLGVQIEGARYIFVHYELVAPWWPWITMCRVCATLLDEAHLVKNPRSLRGKAALMVTSSASLRLLLTGTPVLNRIGEMHPLLTLATGPWTWGSMTSFRQRYVGAYHDGYGWVDSGPTHTEELQQRLGGVFLRRTLVETGIELPAITRQQIRVTFEDRDRAAYRDQLKGRTPQEILAALMGRSGSVATIGWLGALRKITSRAKLKATVELIETLVAQDEDVVVFAWERAMADRIAASVKTPAIVVHGAIPQDERRNLLRDFCSPDRAPGMLLAATYGALSVGVTLTRARYTVQHDMDYVPAVMIQAEKRVHRISQSRAVTSYWMTAKGSIDDMIASLVLKKADAIAASLGDDEPKGLAELLGDRAESEVEESLEAALAWAMGGR